MKKLFKILFGFIGTILAIVLIIGVVGFFMIRDNTDVNNKEVVEKNKDTKTVLNNELQLALENTSEYKEINLEFDKTDLEYLLYSIIKNIKMPENVNAKLTGVGVNIENGKYTIALGIKAYGVSTVARAGLVFLESKGTFKILLNGLKVGNLGLEWIAKKILGFVNTESFVNTLKNQNIYCDIDFNNLEITLTKENMIKMITTNVKDNNKYLLELLVDYFIGNDDAMEFVLGNNNVLGCNVYLNSLQYTEDTGTNYPFDTLKDSLKTLYNNNIITVADSSNMFNYLVNGYNKVNDEIKEFVAPLDLSSIGISNNILYNGVMTRQDEDLATVISNNVITPEMLIQAAINKELGIIITEEMLENVLNSLNFIGYSLAFSHDETLNSSYICVEKIDVELKDEILDLDVILNVNDCKIYANATFDCPDADGLIIDGNLNIVSLGTNNLSDHQKSLLLNYLDGSIKDVDWMDVDPDNMKIKLDFTKIFSENEDIQNLLSSSAEVIINTKIKSDYLVISYNF